MADLDLINTVFEHRLQQADLDRILAVLSETDRGELLKKIGDLLSRISALLEVSNRMQGTLSLDELLPRLMEIVTEALAADRSSLFLLDAESGELFSRVAQGEAVSEIRIPSDAGIAGSVFVSGEAVIIPDAYADARFNPAIDKKTGYKTRNILCAPLRNHARDVIGVAQVLNKSAGDFDAHDLSLLEALTCQASSALQSAQLLEKVERARHEEAQLLEISSAISSELKLDALLVKIVGVTTELLDADRSTLFLHDPRTDQLWSRVAEGMTSKEIRFPSGAGIAGACFASGEVINIPDAYADERFNPEVDRKTGYKTRNILCMPVINKDGTKLGVMQVLNKRGGPFVTLDERRLRAFSAQAAVALENARLFEDVLDARNYAESILKSLSNGVVTLDAQRRVIRANDAAQRIFRVTEDAVNGRPVGEVLGEANAWVTDSVERVMETGEVDLTLDRDLAVGDGNGGAAVSVNMTVVPLRSVAEQPLGCMLIAEDISSEKRVKSTMARYMTKEVMERLLDAGEAVLGGATQEATVLFSDIRSFTTISEELGARETVSMLNDYLTEMVDVIFEHGGILDKYIGDAIMALFGVPFAAENDADRAIAVANQMLVVLRALNARRVAAGRAAIDIGIGVNTGEVVAGNIGSPKRMEYTVIGDTVNLAARLEGANKAYGTKVLFSDFTLAQMTRPARKRSIDLIRVKGKTRPVAVYEALDHRTDIEPARLDDLIAAFEEGIERYRGRRFEEAIGCFERALEAVPGDAPALGYLDRCRVCIDHPPEDGWDGVWTMTEK